MNITFSKLTKPQTGTKTGTLVTWIAEGGTQSGNEGVDFSATAAAADEVTGGAVSRAIKAHPFKGKTGQTLALAAPHGLKHDRLLLVGLGKREECDTRAAAKMGGAIAADVIANGGGTVIIAADPPGDSGLTSAEAAAHIASGLLLRNYSFDKYHTKKNDNGQGKITRVTVQTNNPTKARAAFQALKAVADGVYLTRDLVSEPANVLYPAELAKRARTLAADGLKVEVLGEARMKRLGMETLLAVGMGSEKESQMVVMQWNGAPKNSKRAPIAFVGKGVTFDTGGISIKPSAGMEDMKWDMGGSGVVIGLMRALARRKARVNAVGVVGLVENMPSGSAQRPGDVVKSMSGQTIEVINTDAEGRLVLADALWYTKKRFKPQFMIDLATLTGAIIVSLGNERAGLFSNDKTLSDRLVAAGDAVGEKVWPMPVDDPYDKLIDSDIADMKNVGGRGAGSVTAAKFLERFVDKTPWAHLDIAGMTWSLKDTPLVPKGGTAFGVRLLDRLVADHYES